MKIFAKRTKKVASPGEKKAAASGSTSTPSDKNFASDKIVEEELLKKNPSELNAKERRLVKRYRDRKAQEGHSIGEQEESKKEEEEPLDDDGPRDEHEKDQNEQPQPESESGRDENSDDEDQDDLENKEEDEPAAETEEKEPDAKKRKMNEPTNSNTANHLESVLEAQVFEKLNSKQRRKLSRMLSRTGEDAPSLDEIKAEASAMLQETSGAEGPGNAEATTKKAASEGQSLGMVEVQKMLEGLNSKQRRTLSRRLEREGESCLAEVREEAEKYLKSNSAETATSGKQAEETNISTSSTSSSSGKKRKRKRGSADLSSLTPEERLRREEQRRLQKEAEERRANGEDSSSPFKHPLNSERRRANRRKPKWAPKKAFANERKVEHNASGYHARKLKST